MPPPFGLMSSQRSSRPGVVRELEHDRRERLVHLDHRHVVPRQPGPRERLRARLRVAVQHPVRIDAGEPERRRSAPRGSSPSRDAAASLATSTAAAPSQICARVPGRDLAVGQERRLAAPRAPRPRCRAAASRPRRRASPTCGFVTSTGTISFSKRPSSIAAIARRCDSSEYASSSSRESPHSSAITSAEIPCGTISPALEQLRPRGRRRSSPSGRATSSRRPPRRRRRAGPTRSRRPR